jgi:hypothetical protein
MLIVKLGVDNLLKPKVPVAESGLPMLVLDPRKVLDRPPETELEYDDPESWDRLAAEQQ